MEHMDLIYTIKPIVKKKGLFRLGGFIFIMFIMILYGSVETGEFDSGMFIFQSIFMSILFYVVFRFEYRTIDVRSDKYIYKGLTKKVTVDYKNISEIYILVRENKDKNSYSLILVEKANWQISDIQKYKRKDIEFLIDKISMKNPTIALTLDELKNGLNEVRWLYDED